VGARASSLFSKLHPSLFSIVSFAVFLDSASLVRRFDICVKVLSALLGTSNISSARSADLLPISLGEELVFLANPLQ
jgi:hypothetical protein